MVIFYDLIKYYHPNYIIEKTWRSENGIPIQGKLII